ncbi:glycosyltransferase [Psychrosphaera haliotis]|nr:glycosyltransferase [Psychrosphaera haliotis]
MSATKTVLMIAFEFPPSNGASVPRIESFYRYLKQWGWEVIVLTADPSAYSKIDSTYQDGPDDKIYRTRALDVQRDLSYKGKYFSIMETPDRWGLTWIPSSVRVGAKLIKKYKPDVIWSSAPTPSTHYIANKLSKQTGLPWVADYRDPCHYMNGSAGRWLDYIHKKIDRQVMRNSAHLTYATAAVRDLYQAKYGALVETKNTVIENGFDEANFERLAALSSLERANTPFHSKKFSMYYSGVLYAHGRDPVPIFEAIAMLNNDGLVNADNFELIFQGAGSGEEFSEALTTLGIADLVQFVDPVPFINALNNMTRADALVLIQDARFNKQIPGKVYEYLRTQRPMLVKADSQGATYKLASSFDGVETGMAAEELAEGIVKLINSKNEQGQVTVYQRDLSAYNREQKARQLEQVMLGLV